jgi:hypothetical protein
MYVRSNSELIIRITQLIIRLTNPTKNIKKVQYSKQRVYKPHTYLSGICSRIHILYTQLYNRSVCIGANEFLAYVFYYYYQIMLYHKSNKNYWLLSSY